LTTSSSSDLESKEVGTDPHFGNALQTLVGDATRQTLLMFRIGYANDAALRSPRRDINATLLK